MPYNGPSRCVFPAKVGVLSRMVERLELLHDDKPIIGSDNELKETTVNFALGGLERAARVEAR